MSASPPVPRFLPGVLSRYAARAGCALTALSEDWVWRLERGGRRIVVFGYDFGLNRATTEKLCRDKAATAALLAREGLPAPRGRLLLHPGFAHIRAPEETAADLRAAFVAFGGDVVVKPNEGTGGLRVARAQDLRGAEAAAAELFALEQNALIQPFYGAKSELRIYLLNGRIEIVVEKARGDRGAAGWRGNMGLGATGRLIPTPPDIGAIAAAAAAALDLRFGALDILIGADGPMILEANNGVMLERFSQLGAEEAARAEDLYRRALDLRFAHAGD